MASNLADRLRAVAGAQTLVLTHRGRKSGKPYDVTIWFVVDGAAIVLPGGNLKTNWPRNLRANPDATIKIRSETFHGIAAEITDAAGRARAAAMAQRKYWWAAPFIWLMRALEARSALPYTTASFRVQVSD